MQARDTLSAVRVEVGVRYDDAIALRDRAFAKQTGRRSPTHTATLCRAALRSRTSTMPQSQQVPWCFDGAELTTSTQAPHSASWLVPLA